MPRPSLKDQRTEEILDAYLTCVARFGLEGATQARIAAEAGVARPLLRHNLGNKDRMIAALTDHVIKGFATSTEALEEAAAHVTRPTDLVDLLFAENGGSDPRLMLAWQALTASVADYPEMRAPLLASLTRFLDVIEAALTQVAPQAPQALLRVVTQGIAAPYINLDAMTPLKPPAAWRDELKQAATILAASLETPK
ncbi:TetR/AcrR family transcriptional regulator [uncultured Aliiroseovarius sp.]|uniref:TetR/AcrR family transcriptional regulator n=1 Tax=uncultured Aliiroseovarius sp. TaxID=1658783 RepID=UPI00262C2282|nr:TetR/AcrR family transcriptional regulator [uncultured Aliiroseovarius sp.]